MNILQTFSMALKSIFLNKTRSILTMLGIIIGVGSVITLVSVMQGMQNEIMESYNKMGTNKIQIYYNSWNGVDLTNDLYQFCKSLDEVSGVTPQQNASAKVRYKTKNVNGRINFASDDYDVCNNMTIVNGRALSYADIKNRVRVCTIGSYVADQFFGLENPVGKTIRIQGYTFKVIGVYKEMFGGTEYSTDNSIVLPHSLQRIITGSTSYSQFVVKAKDADSTQLAIDKIKAFLKPFFKEEWNYDVYSSNEWMQQANESQLMLTLVVAGIAGISLLVGGIGIMNIMLVSVTERTREIGIRMAIGARQGDIIWQFLIEAATVSAFGGLLGIGLGTVGSMLLSAATLKVVYYPDLTICLIAFGFSAFLGMFFGFYPARKAAKMPPVEALRNN